MRRVRLGTTPSSFCAFLQPYSLLQSIESAASTDVAVFGIAPETGESSFSVVRPSLAVTGLSARRDRDRFDQAKRNWHRDDTRPVASTASFHICILPAVHEAIEKPKACRRQPETELLEWTMFAQAIEEVGLAAVDLATSNLTTVIGLRHFWKLSADSRHLIKYLAVRSSNPLPSH